MKVFNSVLKVVCAFCLAATMMVVPVGVAGAEPAVVLEDAHARFETDGEHNTYDTAYEIATAAELADFAATVNAGNTFLGKYVKLTNDIDLASVCHSASGSTPELNWTPIGDYSTAAAYFGGTFDGNYKTISNLYIGTTATGNYQGLFGWLYAKEQLPTLKNLIVQGEIETSATQAAGVVARVPGNPGTTATIENVGNEVNVTTKFADTVGGYAGGVVGYAGNKVDIKSCYNTGNISAYRFANGIGYLPSGNTSINNVMSCYNVGTITQLFGYGDNLGKCYSGIVSSAFAKPNVTNCFNYGVINATSNATLGGADVFLDTLGSQPKAFPILYWTHPTQ
jgi:hypothetical protein